MTAEVAIVIVSYNTSALLHDCLASVLDLTDMASAEIIVVDNASADDSVAMVRRDFPMVRMIAQTSNTGFGSANNVGVAAAVADTILLLNSDTVLLQETAHSLARFLRDHPDVACVAPLILLPDGSVQPRVAGHQPTFWRLAMQALSLGALLPRTRLLEGIDGGRHPGPEDRVGWVSGVCMAMRRADFLAVGGFDPGIFMYCEDIDLCSKLAHRGGAIVRLGGIPLRHYGGASAPALAGRVQSTVWQQRNLLWIVRRRSGPIAAAAARPLVGLGLVLRLGAGLALVPRAGFRRNFLLRSTWVRLLDLLGMIRPWT